MEKLYWSSETCKADTEALNTPEKALKQLDKDLYPNIYTLLTFAATVLVTSCECERSISMLRLIGTRRLCWHNFEYNRYLKALSIMPA